MNLKLGRTRGTLNNPLMDKNLHHNMKNTKRPSASPINNNISGSPNHNSPYMPILPKYPEAAAALFQSHLSGNPAMTPFYLNPHNLLNATHPINPYSLGHILEQLQQQAHQQQRSSSPGRMSMMDTSAHSESIPENYCKPEEDKISVTASDTEKHEDLDNFSKSNASECGELVMDEDMTKGDRNEHEPVDAESSTKVAGVIETSKHSSEEEQLPHYNGVEELEGKESQSEGLAAKLEDALTPKSDSNTSGTEDQDYERSSTFNNMEEMDSENYATTDHVNEDGRKVRVRSLISEEQLRILKDKYKENPRPKREELEKIALSIGFQVRVVQVWFQNTRARDRREGRVIQVPYSPSGASGSRYSVPSTHLSHPTIQQDISEQPLDLSLKRGSVSNETSPSCSPRRPHSVSHSESHDEVVNLSHKSSRSPTPYMAFQNHFQGSNSSEGMRQSPSPLEYSSSRLAQILAQPAHKLSGLPGMGMVPMDHLIQFGAHDLPGLTQLISSRMSSLSPSSVHSPQDGGHTDEEAMQSKRAKVQQLLLKSMRSPGGLMSEQEVEGQFQCDQCDKAFSKQSSLARHKYEHSGELIV